MAFEQNSLVVERPWSLGRATTWNATGEMKTYVMEKPTGAFKTCGRCELGGNKQRSCLTSNHGRDTKITERAVADFKAIWQVAALRKSARQLC